MADSKVYDLTSATRPLSRSDVLYLVQGSGTQDRKITLGDLYDAFASKEIASTPASISGLELWFDASDSNMITQSGGAISQWRNKVGNGIDAIQRGSGKPTVQTAAQNGLDTVRFTSASSQYMSLESEVDLSGGYTICAVVRRGGPSGTNRVELFSGPSSSNFIFEWLNDEVIYVSNIGKYIYTSSAVTSTDYALVTAQIDSTGTTGIIRVDQADQSISTSPVNGGSSSSAIFLGFADFAYMNGELAEVCVYSSQLDSTQYGAVETYLKNKWGTP